MSLFDQVVNQIFGHNNDEIDTELKSKSNNEIKGSFWLKIIIH